LPGEWGNDWVFAKNACAGRPRGAVWLPHLTKHDVAKIEAEVREALTELGSDT
jgi:hypothetical protein